MCGLGDDGFEGEAADLEAGIWVRGVDYLSGWRDAREAAAELGDALRLVGVEAAGVRLRVASGADGSGVGGRRRLVRGSHRRSLSMARKQWR